MTNQSDDHRPLPPEIYMRRRVAALAAILVVVVLVVWALTAVARSGSPQEPAETTTAAATEQMTTEPTVPAPGEETTGATETTATASGAGECAVEDLLITASTSKPSYTSGEQPVFYMEVENPTDAECKIDLEEGKLRFEVYGMANNQRVWSDTDCFPPVVGGTQVFEPKGSRAFEARWSATGSQPGQCANREPVPAGAYYLHAVIDETASNPADFTLR